YALTPSPSVSTLIAHASTPPEDMRLRATAAYALSIGASLAYIVSLAPLGVFTLDLGHNRVAYLNAMSGAGHLYALNLAAGTLLLMGLVFASFCRQPPRFTSIAAWAAYLVPNALLTNRFWFSAVLFALLLVLALKRMRRGKH